MGKTCPDCHKAFSTAFCLARHQRCSHKGERPYQCEHCFQNFGYKHVLLHHISKKHPQPERSDLPCLRGQHWTPDIPRLTHMLAESCDPDLGVYVHISRVYLFPVTDECVVLPAVEKPDAQEMHLPGFEEICGVQRRKVQPRILESGLD